MSDKIIQEAQALALQEITGQAPAETSSPSSSSSSPSGAEPRLANFPDRAEMERATGMPKPTPTKRSPTKSGNGESATVYRSSSTPNKRAKTSDAHAALSEVFAEAEEEMIALHEKMQANVPKDSAAHSCKKGGTASPPAGRQVKRAFGKHVRRAARREKPLKDLFGDILGKTTTAYMIGRVAEALTPVALGGAQFFAELDGVMTSLGSQMLNLVGNAAEVARGPAGAILARENATLIATIAYLRENYEKLRNSEGYAQMVEHAQVQPQALAQLMQAYAGSGAEASGEGAKPSGAGPVGWAMWAGKNFLWLLLYVAVLTHITAGVSLAAPDLVETLSDYTGGALMPVLEGAFNMGNSVVSVAQFTQSTTGVVGSWAPQSVRDYASPVLNWIPGISAPKDPRTAKFAQAAHNFYGNYATSFSAVVTAFIIMRGASSASSMMYKRIFGHGPRKGEVVLRDAKGKTMGFLPAVQLQQDERAKIAEAVKDAGLSEEAIDAVAQQVMRTFEVRFKERLALADAGSSPGGPKRLQYQGDDDDLD